MASCDDSVTEDFLVKVSGASNGDGVSVDVINKCCFG